MPHDQTKEGARTEHSREKLPYLQLPADLSGYSVLDLGCHEGFFSIEAKRRGAERVVGLDANPKHIERAQAQAPDIDFRCQSWHEFPEGKFDLILYLSALHHEHNPRAFLTGLSHHLSEDGILVLECGVSGEKGYTTEWTRRPNSGLPVVYHPTTELLTDNWLAAYVVRYVGDSLFQPGDPLRRVVYHCRLRKPMFVFVAGGPRDGKSIIARELRSSASTVIWTDQLLRSMLRSMKKPRSELENLVSKAQKREYGVRQLVEDIQRHGLEQEFARQLARQVPRDQRLVLIEGYALTPSVEASLSRLLAPDGFVWSLQRNRPDQDTADGEWAVSKRRRARRRADQRSVEPSDHVDTRGANRAEVQRLRDELARTTSRLEALEARRSVRAALRLASLARPAFELVRRER